MCHWRRIDAPIAIPHPYPHFRDAIIHHINHAANGAAAVKQSSWAAQYFYLLRIRSFR